MEGKKPDVFAITSIVADKRLYYTIYILLFLLLSSHLLSLFEASFNPKVVKK